MADYGLRNDGITKKGMGWLGPLVRPDGKVSTEISVSFRDVLGGADIPVLVPTLTPEEIQYILNQPPDKLNLTPEIRNKVIGHAYKRDKFGLSPFKD